MESKSLSQQTNTPFKIWEAYTTSFDERGDNIGTIGFYSSELKAQEVAKTRSGPFGRIKQRWAIRVCEQEFKVFLLEN